MLVTTGINKVEYVASASQTAFAIPFPFVPGDITAYVNDGLTSDYVITGTLTEGFYPTATLTFNTARTAGDTVIIRRETARTQQTDYVDHDPFSAASHENALTKLTMIASDLHEITTRCLQLNIALSHGKTGLELPSPDGVPVSDADGRLALVWNAALTNLELIEVNGEVGLVSSALARTSTAGLPTPGSPGRARDVTDLIGGVHIENGTQWWSVTGGYADVRALGARGNASTDDRTVLNAIQAGLPTGAAMRFPGPYTYLIGSNWTITADCQFHPGAVLRPASGVTITINDTVDIQAGRYPIFDRSLGGTIACQSGREVWADWFGAVPDNSTNSGAAFNAALTASLTGMVVRCQGIYRIETAIKPPQGQDQGWKLLGSNGLQTILRRATGYAGVIVDAGDGNPTSNVFEIGDLRIDGVDKAAGTVGLQIFRAGQNKVHDLVIENCEKGIYGSGSSYHRIDNVTCRDNNYGIWLDNADSAVFTHARFSDIKLEDNTIRGLYIDSTIHASGQIRLLSFFRMSVENAGTSSGTDIGIYIKRCDQIAFYDTWHEANSTHVYIEGGDTGKSAANINWVHGNFGNQNVNAPTRTGTHTGGNGSASLIDTTKNFSTLGVRVGHVVSNTTDGSWAIVASLTTTTNPNDTLTFVDPLAGGTDNDFDTGDSYSIPTPAFVFQGTGGNDGVTCTMQGTILAAGQFSFSQPIPFDALQCQVIGTGVLWGNVTNYGTTHDTGTPVLRNYARSEVNDHGVWYLERWTKPVGQGIFLYDRSITTRFSNSTAAFTFQTWAVTEGETIWVRMSVVATVDVADTGAVYTAEGAFQRVTAGAVTPIGEKMYGFPSDSATVAPFTKYQEDGLTNTVLLEESGNNVRIRITPGAATDTVWIGRIERMRFRF